MQCFSETKKMSPSFLTKSFYQDFPIPLQSQGSKTNNDNVINSTSINFVFFDDIAATPKDIIFTEILADPTPQIGLPEREFVEIFNRSKIVFDLAGWELTDQNSILTIPQHNTASWRIFDFILLDNRVCRLRQSLGNRGFSST